MEPEVAMDLVGHAFYVIVLMVTVIIMPSLIVGLLVSMFQAATQINEQTLSFLPRLIITLATISIAGGWLIAEFMELFNSLFFIIPELIS